MINNNKLKKSIIKVKNNNIDLAIKKLNAIIKRSGKLEEYVNRMYYEKPASLRNKKKNEIKKKKCLK